MLVAEALSCGLWMCGEGTTLFGTATQSRSKQFTDKGPSQECAKGI